MTSTLRVALLLSAVCITACTSDDSGGGGGSDGAAGGPGAGGDDGGGASPPTACFGFAPDTPGEFACGGTGLTCGVDQACARVHYPLGVSPSDGITHASCPEPDGCATPPEDLCWVYECWDLPASCGADCGCIEPHLQYDEHPPATCSDDDGHVWIDGAPLGVPPWKDACFGACSGDERCWECGPVGGCMADSVDPACQPTSRCAVEDPSFYPHPTCSERPPL